MSEYIKFCYYNLVNQDSTDITASSENALFPSSNLKHDFSTKVFRSTATSANIVFDFQTAQAVDTILVKGHHIDGFGFTGNLTIEANPTDVWTSPAFTTTLTPNAEFNIGIKSLTTAQSYRYWRVSGTGPSYFELANIFIGAAYQPSRNLSNQFDFEHRDLSTFRRNKYGQRYINKITDQKVISGNINLVAKADVDSFFDFINYAGENKMFWCIVNESQDIVNEKERLSGTFYFAKRPIAKHVIHGLYNFSIKLEEAH